ncbi:wsv213 [White spot syndrome virus]|uniref:Wsv213 n=4 Tax=White spot syndrome virus TaxID=342409 RepID=Q8VB01_WSSVS|nr:wsv213 [Shrimp white spot syndrome virus]AFX59590.1 wsv213 [White spot syndrome virus]AAL33217.1 wsv213 [Shrimp white spot syndrome virus]AAL89136.1 WSSV268 [Shrimp white spot syndrome virus]AWQ60385.1 wsv213 [Shrimp white spot syndrome virus]AWQ60799.1 wsv213 [Shrimp white spot syndrome virus]
MSKSISSTSSIIENVVGCIGRPTPFPPHSTISVHPRMGSNLGSLLRREGSFRTTDESTHPLFLVI